MTTDVEKSHLLTQAIALAERSSGTGGPPKDEVGRLLRAYYRHVALDDLVDRTAEELYGALVSHYRTAEVRPQGTARVHVFTPALGEHGWSAGGHSVVEVVTDDMPFLVDSVVMELTRQQRDVHLVVHPQFDVVRDVTGNLVHVACPDNESAEPPEGAARESWMHVEISRIGHDEDPETIATEVEHVLRDVRESVEDWGRMRQQIGEIVDDLTTRPPSSISRQEVDRGIAFLTWLAEDHFTLLGYREYHLEKHDDGEYLRGVPGTGAGILRNDPDMSSPTFGRLPEKAAATAREKTLLVLAKANSRSTVHRPAYLDYVGVKTFDAAGEVTGERRFLGLFSSAAYTESVWRIPLLREKAKDVLHLVGLDPHSHAGKALIDTLETYPRDELFHTPVDELATMSSRVSETRGRRQLRIFVRRDTYDRYVSVLVFLPRDRYNTTVRERFSEILKDTFQGESVEFTVRMSESTTARVHFVVHPARGMRIPDIDVSELERRLTEASRSWRDDFTAATIAEFGEDVGSTLARTFEASFPEAYKEDFSAATGALDLGRLEALGDGGTDLSLFSPLDAARGEARLKVFRRGAAISLSEVLPALS
jgi:glutamate dehydrogenase